MAKQALVVISRTNNVEFKVEEALAAFPQEWADWNDEDDPEGFIREMVAELGFDLLDFDWVTPNPKHDDVETDVRFRDV